jgi:hypothetical protein
VVEETGVDTFKPTPFSLAIGDESTKVRASLQAALVEPTDVLMRLFPVILANYPPIAQTNTLLLVKTFPNI